MPSRRAAVAAAGPPRDLTSARASAWSWWRHRHRDHPTSPAAWCARFAPADSDPDDLHGHGTFMAGLVAGDGEDVDGIAPAANLVSVKVADDEGTRR